MINNYLNEEVRDAERMSVHCRVASPAVTDVELQLNLTKSASFFTEKWKNKKEKSVSVPRVKAEILYCQNLTHAPLCAQL